MADKRSILIIEDDPQYRELLRKKLELENFEVTVAEDGDRGLSLITTGKPVDLILLDLLMPKMDGVTFLFNLKATPLSNTPVIIITNLSQTAYPTDFNLKDFIFKANTSIDDVVKRVKANL